MQQFIFPASQGRADYIRVVDLLAQNFDKTPAQIINSFKIYDSVLKMPQLLVPSQTLYTFNPVKAVDTPVPGEVKIDKNDFFAITGVGLRFTRATYTSSNGTTSLFGNFAEYTYPYSALFSGTNEATGLQNIVRGNLALSVTSDTQWSLPCSELVYEDQYINAQTQTIQFGGTDGQRGIFPMQSIVVLDGGADNLLSLSLLPGTTTNIDGNTNTITRNFIMPVLKGFVIKNLAGGGVTLNLNRC